MTTVWYPKSYFEIDESTTNSDHTVIAHATPHTKGAWLELISETSYDFDVYNVVLVFASSALSSTSTVSLLDIGYDPAGGTSYGVVIPNILAGGAVSQARRRGPRIFPCYIPRGSSIAARLQSIVVSGEVRVGIQIDGGTPTDEGFPHMGPVVDYGTNESNSEGVVPNEASAGVKGAWKEVVAATTHPHRGFSFSYQCANTSGVSGAFHVIDLGVGAGGSEVLLAENFAVLSSDSGEEVWSSIGGWPITQPLPEGIRLSLRTSCESANRNDDLNFAIYGWG